MQPPFTDEQLEAAALAGARASRGETATINDTDRTVARAVLDAALATAAPASNGQLRAITDALYRATADPNDFEVPAVAQRLADDGVRILPSLANAE